MNLRGLSGRSLTLLLGVIGTGVLLAFVLTGASAWKKVAFRDPPPPPLDGGIRVRFVPTSPDSGAQPRALPSP